MGVFPPPLAVLPPPTLSWIAFPPWQLPQLGLSPRAQTSAQDLLSPLAALGHARLIQSPALNTADVLMDPQMLHPTAYMTPPPRCSTGSSPFQVPVPSGPPCTLPEVHPCSHTPTSLSLHPWSPLPERLYSQIFRGWTLTSFRPLLKCYVMVTCRRVDPGHLVTIGSPQLSVSQPDNTPGFIFLPNTHLLQ